MKKDNNPITSIYLKDLNFLKLVVVEPIPIIEEHQDGIWIAVCPLFNDEYGTSITNKDNAIKSLQISLVELYYMLKQNQNNLGPGMQTTWEQMQVYIKEK